MKETPVVVLAVISVKKGKEAEAETLMRELIPPTRAEAACINYNLHRLCGDGSVFMFHETWASRAKLDQHLATPHLTGFLSRVEPLLTQPAEVKVWEKID
ncbi:antibiotic biosynthesis monooxygenase [bacterium]|nr:antibiotic biosynthesis monooxygenase [bacterium]